MGEWQRKPLYQRADVVSLSGRYYCKATADIWQRIYFRSGRPPSRRLIAYLWFRLPETASCTCGDCAGWRK